ncbi:MAG: hypothetical protein JOY59_00380 [Candidatus Eremiobacteraeota bacterium]|nr:hypothetical protein [Candidatus Eremiobacteraeota bacterium]
MRFFFRRVFAQLIDARRVGAVIFALASLLVAGAAAQAVPTPHPVMTTFKIRVTPPPYPTTELHSSYVVEVNRLGQVIRVRSANQSKNGGFNWETYGNALQAFIRTPDGKAIPGVYRLTYDYSPANHHVHRGVALLKAGGVNANAPGAVTTALAKDAKRRAAEQHQVRQASTATALHAAAPSATPSATGIKLPDFDQIVTPK